MNRRELLTSAAAGAASLYSTSLAAQGQKRPFTFCSWGGTLSAAEREAFMDPFGRLRQIEIRNTSPTETAKIKVMAQSGRVEWDLVTVGGRTVFQGADEDFLERIDFSKVPNAATLDKGWVAPHGVATSTGATVIAWSTRAFPERGPQSWADFWDVKRFPGARGLYRVFYYNYEAALLAQGLRRDEIYPFTPEKAEMALRKVRELKPHVKVWWGSGAQAPQLLSSGELAMSSAWSGRVIVAREERASLDYTFNDGLAWGNWWVVPKGSPNVGTAHEILDFALARETQAKLLTLKTAGPVVGASASDATAEVRKLIITAPENIKDMLIIDEGAAHRYIAAYEERWNQLMLS